jgi:hypothetical protein
MCNIKEFISNFFSNDIKINIGYITYGEKNECFLIYLNINGGLKINMSIFFNSFFQFESNMFHIILFHRISNKYPFP